LDIERGWCSVDVAMRGRGFRFICTHLEIEVVPQLQELQVQELLAGPANTRLPVILAGDFNADALGRDGSTAYPLIPAAGFVDTWAKLHPRTPEGGLTWGHDEYLADPGTPFDRRIDFVFVHGKGLVPVRSNVVDVTTGLRPSPRWASDHAAGVTTLQFK
jgi:endonuclease/exonuclease/phosphatase family metal-dependent hydrolase